MSWLTLEDVMTVPNRNLGNPFLTVDDDGGLGKFKNPFGKKLKSLRKKMPHVMIHNLHKKMMPHNLFKKLIGKAKGMKKSKGRGNSSDGNGQPLEVPEGAPAMDTDPIITGAEFGGAIMTAPAVSPEGYYYPPANRPVPLEEAMVPVDYALPPASGYPSAGGQAYSGQEPWDNEPIETEENLWTNDVESPDPEPDAYDTANDLEGLGFDLGGASSSAFSAAGRGMTAASAKTSSPDWLPVISAIGDGLGKGVQAYMNGRAQIRDARGGAVPTPGMIVVQRDATPTSEIPTWAWVAGAAAVGFALLKAFSK